MPFLARHRQLRCVLIQRPINLDVNGIIQLSNLQISYRCESHRWRGHTHSNSQECREADRSHRTYLTPLQRDLYTASGALPSPVPRGHQNESARSWESQRGFEYPSTPAGVGRG